MSLYPTPTPIPITTFRAEEGYLFFYRSSEWTKYADRDQIEPVGSYLFTKGITVTETHQEHPAIQSYGSGVKNLFARAYIGSSLSVQALYTQEGAEPAWFAPGHEPLVAVVDYVTFMDPTAAREGDSVDPETSCLRTAAVIYDCKVTSKKLSSPDEGPVSYSLEFSCGKVDDGEFLDLPSTP